MEKKEYREFTDGEKAFLDDFEALMTKHNLSIGIVEIGSESRPIQLLNFLSFSKNIDLTDKGMFAWLTKNDVKKLVPNIHGEF